jgi:hypothetical protein
MELPHESKAIAKSPAFAPVSVTELMLMACILELTTFRYAPSPLVVPTF